MLSSCNKENQNQIVQNTDEEVAWTKEDLRIQNNIIGFQDKIKNNTFKNGETIELDSAVWYLEALMNYNYSTPDSSFVNLTVDTTFEFEITVNNNNVTFDHVASAAFEIENHLLDIYSNISDEIKFIIATDITIDENHSKNENSIIKMTTTLGSDYIPSNSCFPPFEENDYWWFSQNVGGCQSNTATSSDAAQELTYKINHPKCFDNENGNTYISEVQTIEVSPFYYMNPDDDISGDNWLDYLLYHECDQIYPVDGCLEPEEMNFYLQGCLFIINDKLQTILNENPNESWKFLNVNIDWYYGSGDYTEYLHIATITYGKRNVYIPPID